MTKNLIIFASGSKDGGGSGFENLVQKMHEGVIEAKIVAVVSNHADGGVRHRADKLEVPFIHFAGPYTDENYKKIIEETKADFSALSGWLKMVKGLDPRTTFNIHPGPLPKFGGKGMYGHYVHEAVMEGFNKGQVTHSAVTMHFVDSEYDTGPIFFRMPVEIFPGSTRETLAARVLKTEHTWQPIITDLVVNGKIGWDGKNPDSLYGAQLYK